MSPFPLGEAIPGGVSVLGGTEFDVLTAASEIVTTPPSPEAAEVFVIAAWPFPMAVSSAIAETEVEATVVIFESA